MSEEPAPAAARLRTARYIADLVGEMERMARRDGFEKLAQSLRAARIEADSVCGEG